MTAGEIIMKNIAKEVGTEIQINRRVKRMYNFMGIANHLYNEVGFLICHDNVIYTLKINGNI